MRREGEEERRADNLRCPVGRRRKGGRKGRDWREEIESGTAGADVKVKQIMGRGRRQRSRKRFW